MKIIKSTRLTGLGCGVMVSAVILSGVLESIELWGFDRLFTLRGPRTSVAKVVMVTIDANSPRDLNVPWPLPRSIHAQVLQRLQAAAPAVIGFDVIFADRSPHGANDDEAFRAEVAAAANVVLAAAVIRSSMGGYTRFEFLGPVSEFARAAAAVGAIGTTVDPDGFVRRAGSLESVGRKTEPSFALKVHDVAIGRLHLADDHVYGESPFLINFRGRPRSFPSWSYYQVLQGQVPPEALRGKVILVGTTDPLSHDFAFTPFARAGDMPGVEVQASIVETLLNRDPIREVPVILSALAAFWAAVLAAVLVGVHHDRGLVVCGLLLGVILGGAFLLFVGLNVWVRPIGIALGLLVGAFVVVFRDVHAPRGSAVRGESR